jgi:hypothetical protein
VLTAQQQGGTERTSREVSRTADFAFMPALELRALIHNKSVSPVEVVTDTLARIEDLQPVLNPFVTITPELALDAARKVEAAIRAHASLERRRQLNSAASRRAIVPLPASPAILGI